MLLEKAIVALMRMVPKGVKLPREAQVELSRAISLLQKGMPREAICLINRLDFPPQISVEKEYYKAVPFGKHRGVLGTFYSPESYIELLPTREPGYTLPLPDVLAHEVGHAIHYALADDLGNLQKYFHRLPYETSEDIADYLGKTQLRAAGLPSPVYNPVGPTYKMLHQGQGKPWQIVHDYIKRLGDELEMKRSI